MYCLLCIINCKVIICTLRYFPSNVKVEVSASLPPVGRRKSEVVCVIQTLTMPLLSLRPADKGLGGTLAG